MSLKKMKQEELESLSYTDLTELILKENKKAMSTSDIFKKVCELLKLTEEDYSNKIGDYYTSLTTDKRFILLDNAKWDLKDKHKVEIVMDDEDDEDEYSEEEVDEEIDNESPEEESIEITDDEVDLDDNDDMSDLTIVDDESLDNEE